MHRWDRARSGAALGPGTAPRGGQVGRRVGARWGSAWGPGGAAHGGQVGPGMVGLGGSTWGNSGGVLGARLAVHAQNGGSRDSFRRWQGAPMVWWRRGELGRR
jgi:hypothetical protein